MIQSRTWIRAAVKVVELVTTLAGQVPHLSCHLMQIVSGPLSNLRCKAPLEHKFKFRPVRPMLPPDKCAKFVIRNLPAYKRTLADRSYPLMAICPSRCFAGCSTPLSCHHPHRFFFTSSLPCLSTSFPVLRIFLLNREDKNCIRDRLNILCLFRFRLFDQLDSVDYNGLSYHQRTGIR